MSKIMRSPYMPLPKGYSEVMGQLLGALLEKNPNLRASIDDILRIPEISRKVDIIQKEAIYGSAYIDLEELKVNMGEIGTLTFGPMESLPETNPLPPKHSDSAGIGITKEEGSDTENSLERENRNKRNSNGMAPLRHKPCPPAPPLGVGTSSIDQTPSPEPTITNSEESKAMENSGSSASSGILTLSGGTSSCSARSLGKRLKGTLKLDLDPHQYDNCEENISITKKIPEGNSIHLRPNLSGYFDQETGTNRINRIGTGEENIYIPNTLLESSGRQLPGTFTTSINNINTIRTTMRAPGDDVNVNALELNSGSGSSRASSRFTFIEHKEEDIIGRTCTTPTLMHITPAKFPELTPATTTNSTAPTLINNPNRYSQPIQRLYSGSSMTPHSSGIPFTSIKEDETGETEPSPLKPAQEGEVDGREEMNEIEGLEENAETTAARIKLQLRLKPPKTPKPQNPKTPKPQNPKTPAIVALKLK